MKKKKSKYITSSPKPYIPKPFIPKTISPDKMFIKPKMLFQPKPIRRPKQRKRYSSKQNMFITPKFIDQPKIPIYKPKPVKIDYSQIEQNGRRGVSNLVNDTEKVLYKKENVKNNKKTSLSLFNRLAFLWKLWLLFNPFFVGIIIVISTYDTLDFGRIIFNCYFVFWLFSPILILYIHKKFNIKNINPHYISKLDKPYNYSNCTGYIYVIKVGTDMPGYIALKIGKTIRNPLDRLSEYRTGNPYSAIIKSWKCYDDLSRCELHAHNIAKQYTKHHKQEVFYFDDEKSIGHMLENINLNINLKEELEKE